MALITGCSSGIGYAAALRLARGGWRVFAALRDPAKAGPLQKEAKGLSLEILEMDVDKPASVQRAFARLGARAGRLDLLVNNAGYGAFGALEDFTDAEVQAQYQTNVLGLMRVTRLALPWMRAQGSGRIIHLGSLAGRMTFAGIGLYCSSKHAVEALTEALRLETRPFGVQVSVIEPGSHHTGFKDNRRKNAVFKKGKSAYQSRLEKILEFGNRQSSNAPGPEGVVDMLERALKDPVMKARYAVGKDARLYPLVRWFLGARLWDLLMARVGRKFDEVPLGDEVPDGKPSSAAAFKFPKGTKPPKGTRVALVTGATSGFGLETAKRLTRAGWRVYGTYRNPHKLDALRALAREGGEVFPLFMDLNRPATVTQGFRRLARKEKRLDLLVNNAGFVMAGFLEDLSDAEFTSQFKTNVFGLLRVTAAALPLMRSQGFGHVVNLGSISGRVAFPGLGAYAASKFALRSLSEGFRQETRPFGVKVCEIAPGSYRTQVVASTRYGLKVKSPESPYRPFTLQMEGLVRREFAKGGDPKEVAELILRAAQSPSPPPVLWAGKDAKALNFFRWLLPDPVFEWALSRAFPWSRRP
ncbi:MAG TPA: SDR family oxidoreductase [bacterium]|nr:SDR family oxidoreductase [bacterium]